MAEEKKKSSWEIPPPGPGTISGFFLAWVFVGGIIGLTIILMLIGKGPISLRVVAYDVSVEGKTPAEVDLEKLALATSQTNAMLLALQGTSEDLTEELSRKLELKYFASKGPSAILARYPIDKVQGASLAVTHFGKIGRFGVMNVDLRKETGDAEARRLKQAIPLAGKEFGNTPHAIFVLASGEPPEAPAGYIEAPADNKEGSNWHVFIPEAIADNLKECYVPTDNKTIKDFSDRLPVVTRFVFRKKDFQ